MGLAGAPVTVPAGQGERRRPGERPRSRSSVLRERWCGSPGRIWSRGAFRYADTHEAGSTWCGCSTASPPGRGPSPSTSTRPSPTRPRSPGQELRARFGTRPLHSLRESRASSPRPSAGSARARPLGMVPGGRADRPGPGSVPGQPPGRGRGSGARSGGAVWSANRSAPEPPFRAGGRRSWVPRKPAARSGKDGFT